MSINISAIILTKNEAIHIERCIKSIQPFCTQIIVIDSYSTDETCTIAKKLGADVIQHPFVNHASQFNYALDTCDIIGDWIWRIDADEYIDKDLGNAVWRTINNCPTPTNGIFVRRRVDFMGKAIRFGGWYPKYNLKLFRKGHGRCENRWMDEHIQITDGNCITIKEGNQIDSNLNNLTWWINKHNHYAINEMLDILFEKYCGTESAKEIVMRGTRVQRKKLLKKYYLFLPLFVRPILYFIYRYFILGGFLDGKAGFLWHFFQGLWYRMLVDAKLYEIRKQCHNNREDILEYLKQYRE